METEKYRCHYCKKEYIPKRRKLQKFCSGSCRAGSHRQNNKKQNDKLVPQVNSNLPEKIKVDQMSLAGIGNAAIGSALVESTKFLLKRSEDNPATKGDIIILIKSLNEMQNKMQNELKRIIKDNSSNIFPFFDL